MARSTTELPRHLGAVANAYITRAERRFRTTIPAGVEHRFSGSLGDYALKRTLEEEIDLRIARNGDLVTHFILNGAGAIRDQEGRTVQRKGPLVDAVLTDIWIAKTELRKDQGTLEIVA